MIQLKRIFIPVIVSSFLWSCTNNVVKINNDFNKFFEDERVKGSFALMNNQKGTVTLNNLRADTQRVVPGAVFKILEVMIGVEYQKIVDVNNELQVPGGDTSVNIKLKDAFDNNISEYFSQLAAEIGKEKMKFWLDSLHYGNAGINDIRSFWYNGDLKVSPDEQLGLLTKTYFDLLPFQKYAQGLARELMLKEDNTQYRYSYTNADAPGEGDPGWSLGWVEENKHVYFFTCLVENDGSKKDYGTIAQKIAHSILEDLGFFKGEK